MSAPLSIPEFYRDKNILITGGTGFIGKVLIEKLVRSCPDLKNIYLLIREKKGMSVEERIQIVTDLPLFDLLRSQQPDFSKKIQLITGDVRELALGLHPQDRKLLTEEINLIFHVAASVRFDDSLTDAVLMNTRGTRELVRLALDMKHLDVLVHISTTYCNTDHKVIEEKLYPPHADWRGTIQVAENTDRHVLNAFTEKFIHPLPNTYVFAKSLAEHVVYDLCDGKIPVVIYRPSVITASHSEPIPGWIDNFNGPMGLLTACCKGIVHSTYGNPDVVADYVPVDMTVKAMIISSWKQATYKQEKDKLTPHFYNGSNNNNNPVSFNGLINFGKKISLEVPLDNVLWYPRSAVTRCYYNYFIQVLFYHLLPAVLIDGLLRILGKKPMLLKIQRRIYNATVSLDYFTLNSWIFLNEKCINLKHELLPCDIHSFSYKEDELEMYDYIKDCVIGIRKYLLKEDGDLEKARRHSRRMWWVAQICASLWYLTLLWIVFVKIPISSMFVHKCNELFIYFATD